MPRQRAVRHLAAVSRLAHRVTALAAWPLLVVALGLLLTAAAAGYVAARAADDERVQLDREAVATEAALADRLARYVDVLQGARGLFAVADTVDRDDWDT